MPTECCCPTPALSRRGDAIAPATLTLLLVRGILPRPDAGPHDDVPVPNSPGGHGLAKDAQSNAGAQQQAGGGFE